MYKMYCLFKHFFVRTKNYTYKINHMNIPDESEYSLASVDVDLYIYVPIIFRHKSLMKAIKSKYGTYKVLVRVMLFTAHIKHWAF